MCITLVKLYKNYFERLEYYDSYERNLICKEVGKKKRRKVLDLGSGLGNMLARVTEKGYGYGVEIIKHNIELAKKYNPGFKYIHASAEKIPLEKEFFDLIISSSSMEHMGDLKKVVREAHRLLKTKHYFVFSIDCFNNENIKPRFKKKYFREREIKQEVTMQSMTEILNDAGFQVIKAKYLFTSHISNNLQLLGLKLAENRFARVLIVPILSIFAYPMIKISDSITKNKPGNVLVIKAVKK